MDTTVLDLLKRSAAIPSMPQVATRFLEIVQQPDFAYADVVEVLSTDPGTAAEILRLANSALFGVTRQVTGLQQAITLLGIKRVRSLVLGRYIVDSINCKSCATIDPAYYWRRSLTTAVLAARLADAIVSDNREEAFISGLLADIGVVILDDALPDPYRPIAEQYSPEGNAGLCSAEQVLLGANHAEVSALVLEHWQLPDIVCEAVRRHPWELHQDDAPVLARAVGAADRIAKRLCEHPADLEIFVEDCRRITQALDLDVSVLAGCLEEIEPQIREFAELLHIDALASPTCEMIAAELRDKLAEPSTSAV